MSNCDNIKVNNKIITWGELIIFYSSIRLIFNSTSFEHFYLVYLKNTRRCSGVFFPWDYGFCDLLQLCALKKELRPSVVPIYASRPAVQRTMSQGTGSSYSTIHPYGSSAHISACFAPGLRDISEGSIEMQKVKKVQSFFRGWLCRRRWKQIVEQYIKSPHAESMRKRNR